MKSAQITIYLTLIFTIILSVFLSAFEAARGGYLKIRMETAVQTAIHSTFGEYHKVMYERYGLLFVDTSYMTEEPEVGKLEERLAMYLKYNLQPEEEQALLFARDWYGVEETAVALTNIRLATDNDGEVLKQQAISYVKNYIGGDWIEEVKRWISVKESYDINEDTFRSYYEDIQVKKDEVWMENNLLGGELETKFSIPSICLLDNSFAELVSFSVGDKYLGFSTKSIETGDLASNRSLMQGTGVLESDCWDIAGELFFNEYILMKLGNYSQILNDSALDYQAEYILFGESSDIANMLRMVESLFLIRGCANLVMLLNDSETQDTIETISKVGMLAGVKPEVLKAVINGVWTVVESIDDVKKLLNGEDVIFLKEPKDFSVSLVRLIILVDPELFIPGEDNDIENNKALKLGYEDYLRMFLYSSSAKDKVLRCMDMMEADIRLTEGNEHFRLDGCTDAISAEFGVTNDKGYFYTMERNYSYF